VLRGGLTAFFFQYLLQAGLFFAVPLFLSVALGLSAVATGVRLLPLSITLLLAAAGIPKVFPNASPRRVVQAGVLALLAGIVVMVAALDAGAGPEIVTWPMLLAGLGIGALASQLGAVTVSSVPDEQSSEVGGLQNTGTNLGASIGTALAGAVLISTLTTSFLTSIEQTPTCPTKSPPPPSSSRLESRSSPMRTYKPPSTKPGCPRQPPTPSPTRTPPPASTRSVPRCQSSPSSP
jgi:MFS family permease